MKHINRLILKNFQQWKNGDIHFKEGLNVIVGNTESGKSTIFRSLYSILSGKMPEDYIRKGTKGCEVEVQFGDGSIFRRKRSNKENIAEANGKIFERVGKEVPSEYFNLLGKTSIEVGNKEISLCSYSQFEPHFFITLSDYDKNKLIGTICGIDIVDKLVDSINKDIRSNNNNIKFLETQIQQGNEQFKLKEPEFKLLDTKVNNISIVLEKIKKDFIDLNKLNNNKIKLEDIKKHISDSQEQLSKFKFDFDSSKSIELYKLFKAKNQLGEINKTINAKQNELKTIKSLEIDFSDNIKLLTILDIKRNALKNIKSFINDNQKALDEVQNNLKSLEESKHNLLKGFDKCPLCGGIINE